MEFVRLGPTRMGSVSGRVCVAFSGSSRSIMDFVFLGVALSLRSVARMASDLLVYSTTHLSQNGYGAILAQAKDSWLLCFMIHAWR